MPSEDGTWRGQDAFQILVTKLQEEHRSLLWELHGLRHENEQLKRCQCGSLPLGKHLVQGLWGSAHAPHWSGPVSYKATATPVDLDEPFILAGGDKDELVLPALSAAQNEAIRAQALEEDQDLVLELHVHDEAIEKFLAEKEVQPPKSPVSRTASLTASLSKAPSRAKTLETNRTGGSLPEIDDDADEKKDMARFKLHKEWMETWQAEKHPTMMLAEATASAKAGQLRASNWFTRNRNSITRRGQENRFRLYPSSSTRMAWDVFSMLFLCYDIVYVPILAFSPSPTVAFDVMDWITLSFWTVDMVMTCFTAVFDNGVLVIDLRLIFLRYFKSWFLVDALVVIPDWAFSIVGLFQGSQNGEGDAKYSRLLRTTRVVRILRLLRLAKLQRFLNVLKDMIETEAVFLGFSVVQLIALLLVVNHLVGCLWYLIGDMGRSADSRSWIDVNNFYQDELFYRYVTSLHWALTQFTPGSMDVQPMNTGERIFAILVLVFGLIMFSSVTASITAAMTQLRNLRGETAREFWLLRRYLRQRQTPHLLTTRILRYAEYAHKTRGQTVDESRVTLLAVLSGQLRNELSYVVSFPGLLAHPLFLKTTTFCTHAMHKLAEGALKKTSMAYQDMLFSRGTLGTQMHVIDTGEIRYVHPQAEDEQIILTKGDWLCEQALWTAWVHVGDSQIVSDQAQLVTIDALTFRDVIGKDTSAFAVVATYARRYVEYLNDEVVNHSDVSLKEKMTEVCAELLEDNMGRTSKLLAGKQAPHTSSAGTADARRTSVEKLKWTGTHGIARAWAILMSSTRFA